MHVKNPYNPIEGRVVETVVGTDTGSVAAKISEDGRRGASSLHGDDGLHALPVGAAAPPQPH